MKHDVFEEPVRVYVGLNMPREVTNPTQAHAFLLNCPMHQRRLGYSVALMACRGAMIGEIEHDTARGAFVAFADRAGILAPEVEDAAAARELGVLASSNAAWFLHAGD